MCDRIVRICCIGTHQQYDAINAQRNCSPTTRSQTMDIEPIRTKADYEVALKTVEALMNAQANTPEGDILAVLVPLIEAYERQHFPS